MSGAILLFIRFRDVFVQRRAKHAEARSRDVLAARVITKCLTARAPAAAGATATTLQRVAAGAHRGFDSADGEALDYRRDLCAKSTMIGLMSDVGSFLRGLGMVRSTIPKL
jgi:hypothetical protein